MKKIFLMAIVAATATVSVFAQKDTWQSDVDISRAVASISFYALQGNPDYISQMKKAQAEYKKKISKKK